MTECLTHCGPDDSGRWVDEESGVALGHHRCLVEPLSTVAGAVDEAVAHWLAHRDLSGVTHIGIDEIASKRGHVYVTNVYNLKINTGCCGIVQNIFNHTK